MDSKSQIRVHQRVLNLREKEIEQNFSGNFSLMAAPEDVNWAMSKEKCTCDIDDGEKEFHCLHQCDCSINRRTCGARCPCYGNCQYNSFLSLPQTEVQTNQLGKKVVVALEDIEFGRISCVITGSLVSVQDDLKRESRRQLGAIKYSITAKWRGRDRNLPGLPGIPTFVIDTQASPAGVLNHNCRPNNDSYEVWQNNKIYVIARVCRHIAKGEELTLDYQWVYGNEDDEYADICLCGENECRGIAARPGSSVMQRSIQHYDDVIRALDLRNNRETVRVDTITKAQSVKKPPGSRKTPDDTVNIFHLTYLLNISKQRSKMMKRGLEAARAREKSHQLAHMLPGCFGVSALSPPRSPKGKLMPNSYKEELEVASVHALPSDSDEEYQMKHVPNLRELLKLFEARKLRDDLGFQDPLVGTILRYILKWSEEAGPRGRSNPELEEALGWYEEKLLPRGRLGLLDPIVGHVLRDLLNWYKFRRYPAHATKTETTTTNSQKAASSSKSLDSDSEERGGRPQLSDAQSIFSSQSSRSLHDHYPNNRPSSSPSSLCSPSSPSWRRQTQSPRAKAKVSWDKNVVHQSPGRTSRARTPERPRRALGRKGVWEMWKQWMGRPTATTVEGILAGREVERSTKNGKKSGEWKQTATFTPFSPVKGKSRRSSNQSLSEGGSPRGSGSFPESPMSSLMSSLMSSPGRKDFDIPIQPAVATAADGTHESKAEDSSVEWDQVDWGHGLLKPQEITDACMFDDGVVKIRGIVPWPGTMRWFYWLHKTFRHPTTDELADFGKTWIGLRITTLQGGTAPQKLTLNTRPTEREVRAVMKRVLKLVPSRIGRRKFVEDANRGNMYPLVWADMNKLESYLSKIESARGTHFQSKTKTILGL